jgi:hypothetical protein
MRWLGKAQLEQRHRARTEAVLGETFCEVDPAVAAVSALALFARIAADARMLLC